MRARRLAAVAAFGLVTALGVAACGSGGDSGSASAPQQQREAAAGGMADQKPASVSGDPAAGQSAAQPVPASERKVVRTAQLSLEVDDVFAAARTVRDVGTRFGGFVADEKTSDGGASVQLKVAADRLDDALAALSDLQVGKVTNRGQQAQDVTEQVVDVQARMASQRASVERVRALLDHATAISEIVQIESELTRRQADLESLEKRAAALNAQVELATIGVDLHKPGGIGGSDGDEAGFLGGLNAGWRVFLASTEVLLTVFGALLPFLIALAVPTAIIVWLLRRRRPVPAPAPAQAATPRSGS